jgi:hypothetical protein
MLSHRTLELIVGISLIGYCAYAVSTGRVVGRWRVHRRADERWAFWGTILLVLLVGGLFLLGTVSWRE